MAGSLEGMDKRPSLNQECITPSKCNFKQTLKRWVVLDIHLGGGQCSTYGLHIHHQMIHKNITVGSQGDRHRQMYPQGTASLHCNQAC